MCRGLTCVILSVFNIVFLIAGLVLLIAGSILRWNKDLTRRILSEALNAAQGQLGSDGEATLNRALDYIQQLAAPIGLVLFIGGIVICVIAILAIIGLCCHIRLILIVYAILVSIVILAHVLILIIYFANKGIFLNPVKDLLHDMVINYQSVESQDTSSVALAIFMPTFQCCGYVNGDDFNQQGTKFTHEDSYDGRRFTNLAYPIPCCKSDQLGSNPNQCPTLFTTGTSYKGVGCLEQFDNQLVPHIDFILKLSLIVLGIEIIVLILVVINLHCSK